MNIWWPHSCDKSDSLQYLTFNNLISLKPLFSGLKKKNRLLYFLSTSWPTLAGNSLYLSLRLPEQSAPCRPGCLNNRYVFSYRSGDWQSKIKTMAGLFFPEASLLGSYLAVFSLCPQGSSHCVCLCRNLLCKTFFKSYYLFLAVLNLCCFTGFSLAGSRGYSLAVVRGLLITVTSLILELSSALGCVGFSRCGAWAQ